MAQYTVTGADGKTYTINSPMPLTQSQIDLYVEREINGSVQGANPADRPGFWGAAGNATARMAGRSAGLVDASQAETYAGAAAAQREMDRRAEAGEMSWLDKIATWRPSWAAPLETPEELEAKAAGLVRDQAVRNQAFAEAFPMSARGERGVQALSEVDGFWEGAKVVANQPLDVLAGALEVGAEQAPVLAASAIAAYATKNPNAGMAVMGGGSYAQERFGQMADTAHEFGYDLTNPEQALAAVQDEAFMQEQEARGMTRGGVIALIDAATFKAGSLFKPNLKGLAANAGLQVGGGASGEALAQYGAEGEISAPGEVILEGLAEGPFSAIEMAAARSGVKRDSGTNLDGETANALAEEEAKLAQEAQQAAQEAARQSGRERLQAAPDFMSFKQFKAERDNARLESIRDADSQEGQDFLDWLAETRTADRPAPTTEAELTKEIKAYIKDTTSAGDADAAYDAYNEALDAHIVFRKEEAARSPEATQQARELKEGLLAERAAALEAGDKKAVEAVDRKAAASLLPGEWRYATMAADGKLGKPAKGGLSSTFTPAVETESPAQPTAGAVDESTGLAANASADPKVATVEADTLDAAPTPGEAPAEAEAPPVRKEAGRTLEMRQYAEEKLGEDWEEAFPDMQVRFANRTGFYKKLADGTTAFQRQVDKAAADKAAEADTATAGVKGKFKPDNSMEEMAVEYAERELGEDWENTHPDLLSILEARKYGLFSREVDAAAEKAEADRLSRGGVAAESRSFVDDPKLRKSLSKQEAKLYDELVAAFREDRVDDVISADGEFMASEIADRLGFKSKQNVSTAMKRIRKKMAESRGVTEEQVAQELAASAASARQGETADPAGDMADQIGAVRGKDGERIIPEGMSAVSAGGSAAEGAGASSRKTKTQSAARKREVARFKAAGWSDEKIKAFYEGPTEAPSPEVEAERTQVKTDTQRKDLEAVEYHDEVLRAAWNSRRSNGGPEFDALSPEQRVVWMNALREYALSDDAEGRDALLDEDQRELEKQTIPQEADDGAEQQTGDAGPDGPDEIQSGGDTAPAEETAGTGRPADATGSETGGSDGKTGSETEGSGGRVRVYRAQRTGNKGPGVGEAAYGVGEYWSQDQSTADGYKDTVVPVTITGPKGRSVELNQRDALGDRAKLNQGLAKAGIPTSAREAVVRAVAGEAVSLPEGVTVEKGTSEVVEQELDTTRFVEQTDKGRYNEYDLNNMADVRQLQAQGIEGTFYTGDGVTNYVKFPKSDTTKPVVVTTKRRAVKKPTTGAKRFSKTEEQSGTPITVSEFQQMAEEKYGTGGNSEFPVAPGSIYSRIQIHATPKDALRARHGANGTMTMADLEDAQAFIDPADPGVAHFIVSNMTKETAAGVLDHEVGVHVGLEAQLDPDTLGELSGAVHDWENLDEGTVENQIYRAAMARVAFARATGMDVSLADIELLAYAVEEAVNAGVTPDANAKSAASRWLADVASFFSKLIHRFINKELMHETGSKDLATTPVISAEELVALAQAAARTAGQDMMVESGASADTSNPDHVMGYYVARERGRPLAEDAELTDGVEYPGLETFFWGKGSSFGPHEDITTTVRHAAIEDGVDLEFTVNSKDAKEITSVGLLEVAPNVFALTIWGPDEGTAGRTKVQDTEGASWSRLEGVTHAQTVRLLTEVRRRLTRFQGGIVPNIVFNRVTGAASTTTTSGRRGDMFYEDVRKRFSKRAPDQQSKGEVSIRNRAGRSWVKKNFGGATAQAYDSLASFVENPIAQTYFLYDLVEKVQDKMPSAKAAYRAMRKQEAVRNELQLEAEGVANRAGALEPERYELVNDFLGKSTFYQKWGYDPNKTHPELFKGRKIKIDPVMAAAWKRLTAEEQSIVSEVFAQGEVRRQRMQNFMKKLGLKENYFTSVSKLEGPYAPLKRFGNYVAVLKSKEVVDLEAQLADSDKKSPKLVRELEKLKSDGAHYVVQLFDTQGAANRFAEANSVENKGNYHRVEAFVRDKKFDDGRAPTSDVLEKLLGRLKADDKSGLDASSKEAFRKMIHDQYFSMMDERDARTSGARRLNRAGYDKDMIRAFLFQSSAQAAMISTMEESANVHVALADMRNEAKADRGELQETFRLISDHYNSGMRAQDGTFNAIQDRITAVNTVYMLTTSVGYHVQNATQTMIAANKLFGDFGDYSGAWTALFRGYKLGRSAIKGAGMLRQAATTLSAGLVDFKNNVEIDADALPAEYRELVQELQLHQLADMGLQEDLRQFNRFDTGFGMLNKASDKMAGVAHRLYQVARYVEAHNRLATAIAAYDMAKKNPQRLRALKKDSPIGYAVSAVQRTQGAFNGLDAPLAFKKLPKVTTQYRKYQVMMAFNYARALDQMFAGESSEIKWVGARTLAATLSHAAITSGIRGLPMLSSVGFLLSALAGDDDEVAEKAKAAGGYDKYVEMWVRENVEDEKVADLLTRGVPAFFGLDMSDKIGHQNIFAFQPYNDFELTRDGVALYGFGVISGPSGTMVRNVGAAGEAFRRGDHLKGMGLLLPKGVRSAIESYRMATEGMTFTNGELLLDPRNIDMKSLMINALGLAPTEVAKIKWTRSQQYEMTEYFSKRSSRLRDAYANAKRKGDRDRMAELRNEWRELQKAKGRVRPFFNDEPSALRPQPVSDLLRVPRDRSRQATKDRRKLGTD